MPEEGFVRGTITLTTAGALNRAIGFLYNMYLIRMVGTESIGIFRMVLSVYVTLLVIASAGIPYAVSKMVSERNAKGDHAGVNQVIRLALAIVVGTSTAIVLLFYAFSELISTRILSDPRTLSVIYFTAPGIFVTSLASIYRGYFQGLQNMVPPAASQIIEQLTHAVLTLGLAHYLSPLGPEYVAVGMSVGMVAGEAVGLGLIVSQYKRHRPSRTKSPRSRRPILGEMLSLSVPATAGRVIASLSSTVNVIIIPARLQAGGLSVQEASELFGLLIGVALPLVFLPNIINVAMSISLVPSISSSLAKGRRLEARIRSEKALLFTYVMGLPVAVLLGCLGGDVAGLLYGQPQAGPVLAVIAFGAVFAYLRQTTMGILQGLGLPSIPVRNYIIAISTDTLIVYFLAADPRFGIIGAALSSAANFIVSGGLNTWEVFRRLQLRPKAGDLALPAGAALLMILFVTRVIPSPLAPSALGGLLVYFGALWCLGFSRKLGLSGLVKRD